MLNKLFYFSLFIISLLFLYLTFFTSPNSDDFCMASKVLDNGFIESNISYYKNWSGRFTQGFLLYLFPITFDLVTSYWVGPFIIYLYSALSFYLLVDSLLKKIASRTETILISLMFFLLYLAHAPHLHSALYWNSGSFTYQICNASLLILFSILLSDFSEKLKKQRILISIFCFFITAFTIGTNEITIISLGLISCTGSLVGIYLRTPNRSLWFVTFATVIVSGLFSILAPGNTVRGNNYEHAKKLISSIFHASIDSIYWVLHWSSSLSLWALAIIFLPFALNKINGNDIANDNRYNISTFLPFFWIIILTSCFFTVYYATGNPPADRTLNAIYLLFLLGWFSSFVFIFSAFKKKVTSHTMPSYVTNISKTAFLIGLLVSNNFQDTLEDTIKIKKTSEFIKQRYQLIKYAKTNNNLNVSVPKIKYWSKVYYQDNLTNNPNSTYNRCTAKYFRLTSIKTDD